MKKLVLFFLLLNSFYFAGHAKQTGKIYAILVGVSQYEKASNNLAFPHKDASEMYHLLKLHTASSNLVLLTNQQATKENIIRVTNDLFSKASPQDIVLFFSAAMEITDAFIRMIRS